MQNVMHRQTKRAPAPPTRRFVWVDGGHHADVEGGGDEGAGNAGGAAGCIGANLFALCWRRELALKMYFNTFQGELA